MASAEEATKHHRTTAPPHHRTTTHQEYVGRLEVAVHDPPLMHVLYRLADLREVAPNHPLLKARLPLLRLTNLALEVARGRPLEDDDELLGPG